VAAAVAMVVVVAAAMVVVAVAMMVVVRAVYAARTADSLLRPAPPICPCPFPVPLPQPPPPGNRGTCSAARHRFLAFSLLSHERYRIGATRISSARRAYGHKLPELPELPELRTHRISLSSGARGAPRNATRDLLLDRYD
jgi:hypothetical protein